MRWTLSARSSVGQRTTARRPKKGRFQPRTRRCLDTTTTMYTPAWPRLLPASALALALATTMAASLSSDECGKYGTRLPPNVTRREFKLQALRAPAGAKALVTGSAGFIASHVAREAMKLGFDTVCVDDMSGGFKQNIPDGCRFVQGKSPSPTPSGVCVCVCVCVCVVLLYATLHTNTSILCLLAGRRWWW